MIANDFGYPFVFSKQIMVFGNSEDLLITISCSGTSPNVINAQNMARIRGVKVYKFDSFKGKDKDYERLEDIHLKFAHRIKKAL